MKRLAFITCLMPAIVNVGAAGAQQVGAKHRSYYSPPFNATLSNLTPLAFGMDAQDTSLALGTPLHYLSGGPGAEIFLAYRHAGGSGLFVHNDRLYLQFRHGRLAGWKGDWGRNWMWQ